jgi:hypothetical protein
MQILGEDIFDTDVAAYLRFCYCLMINDYPITEKKEERA